MYASNRKLFQMERSPAEVSMGRHSLWPAEREQLRRDTTRRTSTTESYRARKRQLEKNPGRIWSVMSRSSLAIPMLSTYAARSFRQLLLKLLVMDALVALMVRPLTRKLQRKVRDIRFMSVLSKAVEAHRHSS